jgi:nitrate reductase gamma subunit
LDLLGITAEIHIFVAFWSGLAVGLAAFLGALLLLWRRLTNPRIRAAGTLNDMVTVTAIVIVTGAGIYNVIAGHYNVLYTIAPWIRGIVFFAPDPYLMIEVPVSYTIHVIAALALLGFSPFSRLIHIWSAPFSYAVRRYLVFRKLPGKASDEI